ncbi:MAG: WbuC family cupin fold metalloprotein [Bryobacteraceae bacterium]
MARVQLITTELFGDLESLAASSPRRRINHNFHSGPGDNPHRMLNVLLRGTYVRPHRHVTPPKCEAFLPLTGRVGVVCFDDNGATTAHHELDASGPIRGIDLASGLWHTVLALSDVSVCYEVKPGPWEPASDKDFAPWAPTEGVPAADELVKRWAALFT